MFILLPDYQVNMPDDRRSSVASDRSDPEPDPSDAEDEGESRSQKNEDSPSESPSSPASARSDAEEDEANEVPEEEEQEKEAEEEEHYLPKLPPKDRHQPQSLASTISGMPIPPPRIHNPNRRSSNPLNNPISPTSNSKPTTQIQPATFKDVNLNDPEMGKHRRVCGLPPWAFGLLACLIALLVITVILVPSLFLGKVAMKGGGRDREFGDGMVASHEGGKLAVRAVRWSRVVRVGKGDGGSRGR